MRKRERALDASSRGRARSGPLDSDSGSSSYVYKDQSASDLRLHLLRGELDLRQFALLDAARLERPRLRVHACIIGASHLLQVELPGAARFNEVFACAEVGTASQRVFRGPLEELPGALELEIAAGASYRFRSRLATDSRRWEPLRALEERVRRARARQGESGELGLCFEFPRHPTPRRSDPAGAQRCDEAPKTMLWAGVDASGGTLRVESVHSYPNEDCAVFSETRIRVAAGCGGQQT
jgi:hypothetical protein